MIFYRAASYLRYLILSGHRNGHGIHSPFVFDIVTKIFRNKSDTDIVLYIEKIRDKMISDTRVIRKNDLGCIEMGVYGNFCWFNCAQKWINEKCKIDGTHDDKTRMLKILYEMFTGNKIQKIVESEDKTVMKQFCGEHGITQQEYRDNMNLLNSEYELTEYKLSHFTPNVD